MDYLSRLAANRTACSILASHDSLIAVKGDVLPLINRSLESVITKDNHRADSLEYLSLYSSQQAYARLGSNVDKLPALIESADRTNQERAAMVDVFSSLLINYNSDVSTQLPKVLTKLVGVACRICGKDDASASQYGLNILRVLAESRARPLMLPFSKQVRQVCLQVISTQVDMSDSHTELCAEVFSAYASMESAEMWTNIWCDVVREGSALLGTLGVGISRSAGNGKKANKGKGDSSAGAGDAQQQLVLLAESQVQQLRGVNKTVRVQQLFRGVTSMLTHLLRCGCSSGFVALNVSQFLPLLQTLMSVSAEVNARDPVVRSNIISRLEVSPLTLVPCFVLCLIVVH
jgi:hypothetical protein